ncbi:MAG: energy-coupling factor ABC transporter ATP-binding protein, partial [Chloroflexota bacterium]|nr:energy-coupling factor ABC transporter ATP-binding protein [Chloroflexota bacterium]
QLKEPPLRLEGVRYRYAGASAWVLGGIDLVVQPGRVVAVVGANDAGKSSLCLVASGLAPAVIGGHLEGSVRLDGRETLDLKPHEAAQRCGILFQNPLTQLSGTAPTVWEEIAFGPRNLGLDLAAIVERVEAALASLRIGHLAARDPARLSGGQAQLVALASVLAIRPRCLVLDEPTSQLDPEGTRLVGDAIRRIADGEGSAVLVVEHKTALLTEIADEALVLDAGRVHARGGVDGVLGDPSIVELGIDPPPLVRLRRGLESAGAPADTISRVVAAALTSARAPR